MLHGDAGNPRSLQRISEMDRVADRHGFFVVYPEGSGWLGWPPRSWNAGNCCGYARNAGVDDVAFLRALIAQLLRTHPIDPARVYAAGISNGGMMAHRLACELSDRLAAIAVVSGTLAVERCSPSRPLPLLMIHGTADRYVPYEGGRGALAKDQRTDRAVADVASWWAARNGCDPAPRHEERGRIRQQAYEGCAEAADVLLYTLQGGGHAWPGGLRGWRFGKTPATELPASEVIWEFFSRHQLPGKNQ